MVMSSWACNVQTRAKISQPSVLTWRLLTAQQLISVKILLACRRCVLILCNSNKWLCWCSGVARFQLYGVVIDICCHIMLAYLSYWSTVAPQELSFPYQTSRSLLHTVISVNERQWGLFWRDKVSKEAHWRLKTISTTRSSVFSTFLGQTEQWYIQAMSTMTGTSIDDVQRGR